MFVGTKSDSIHANVRSNAIIPAMEVGARAAEPNNLPSVPASSIICICYSASLCTDGSLL